MSKLIPVDRKRCQAEMPNGAGPFTIGGRPGMVRCTDIPSVIATEIVAGKDGQKGSMSLCLDCQKVMEKQMPGHCTFEDITTEELRTT